MQITFDSSGITTAVLPDGQSLVVDASGYRITISANDGIVQITACGGYHTHSMELDIAKDSLHPDSIRLDRNLALCRMPAGFLSLKCVRLLVFNHDSASGNREILDIWEGSPVEICRIFNSHRRRWETATEAQLEDVSR